jgi:hypothetical protein
MYLFTNFKLNDPDRQVEYLLLCEEDSQFVKLLYRQMKQMRKQKVILTNITHFHTQ